MQNKEMEFKNIVSKYCDMKPEDIKNDMRFREDLGFSSLDFMSFRGEWEDTFDVELEEENVLKIIYVSEALEILETI